MNIIYTLSRPSSPAVPIALSPAEQYLHSQGILCWIDIPDLTSQDLEFNKKGDVVASAAPGVYSCRAAHSHQHNPAVDASPSSRQLLIHGDYDSTGHVSGLSLFCTILYQSLADKAHFIRLAFFCGLCTDSPSDAHAGARARGR